MMAFRRCSLFILFFAVLYFLTVQNLPAQNIKHFDEVLNALSTSDQDQAKADASHFKSLIYDVQPRLYIDKNGFKNSSDSRPVCVTTDPQSYELLYETNPLFEQVELITVNILNARDLNFIFDMTRLKSFSKLKYVYFLCNYNCDPALIRLQWPNLAGSVIVFYQISLPE
ncbi:MAG TPA: hypothetical protein PLI16_02670 [Bacteroidales bacterium]|nr:hypothetical protein [Bacteroidales bacterium]HNZ43057.1 hypothetical protein [Bacteroidales bacterium]HOH83493.1 hypothetical protein [Bacteroidales bacterium]HPB25846.1 hypothetical protein [Bacteroidales bacterium]HPI30397.1 hypothetical protein [Bacteroidales bacterium]